MVTLLNFLFTQLGQCIFTHLGKITLVHEPSNKLAHFAFIINQGKYFFSLAYRNDNREKIFLHLV